MLVREPTDILSKNKKDALKFLLFYLKKLNGLLAKLVSAAFLMETLK